MTKAEFEYIRHNARILIQDAWFNYKRLDNGFTPSDDAQRAFEYYHDLLADFARRIGCDNKTAFYMLNIKREV